MNTSTIEVTKRYQLFGGKLSFFKHESRVCQAPMAFSVYEPPMAAQRPTPVLYWLSGLGCNEENFMAKAGAQRLAAQFGLLLVAPDTSPRGLGLPGEDDDWDFGSGAGFYVNAVEQPWARHYQMYDYVVDELPRLIHMHFNSDPKRESIFGHSMGGHGALMIAVRNQDRYRSASAFAPVCAPMRCPWGVKAFTGYLGAERKHWRNYDTVALLSKWGAAPPLLVDQGLQDNFLGSQLMPELLEAVCGEKKISLKLRRHKGYDHSYYFIATFIQDHLAFHAEALQA